MELRRMRVISHCELAAHVVVRMCNVLSRANGVVVDGSVSEWPFQEEKRAVQKVGWRWYVSHQHPIRLAFPRITHHAIVTTQ